MDNQRKLRVFEGFSGYGSHSLQLKAMGIPHEVVGTSEIDTYAIVAYSAVHDNFAEVGDVSHEDMLKYLQDRNIGYDFKKDRFPNMTKKRIEQTYSAAIGQKCYGDISLLNVNDLPDMDLFTYSYPCQDISISGLQKGLDKNSGTRSSLLWECQKVIEGKKPAFTMMENVKNLIGKAHRHNFDEWLEWMELMGYNNYWKVINAKHCGIPQNRERVFLVSVRKDVDDGSFKFEEDFDSGLRLKDFLEDKVDEKYYIENERVNKLLEELNNKDAIMLDVSQMGREGSPREYNEYSPTLSARDFKDPRLIIDKSKVLNVNPSGNGMNGNVYNTEAESPTLTTNKEEGIKILESPTIVASRGRYIDGNNTEQQLEPRADGCTNTITTVQKDNMVLGTDKIICEQRTDEGLRFFKDNICGTLRTIDACGDKRILKIDDTSNELQLHTNLSGGKWDKIHESARRVYDENGIAPTVPTCGGGNIEPKTYTNYRIRKLTPRECFRLMGLTEGEIDKIQASDISNSQQYKLAGNSIVKQCMTFLKNLPFDRLK